MSDPSLEKNAPWGLARISHRDGLTFGTFNKYLYTEDGGEGVDAYVIDTGTNIDHVDFEGRAHWGKTIPVGDPDEDGNGHGTHCSGTIAGKKFGVAKKANVYAVKVLKSNGSGTMSDVVKGVEWAAISHTDKVAAAKKGKSKKFKGSVANMSLGGGKSTTLDLAVNAAVDAVFTSPLQLGTTTPTPAHTRQPLPKRLSLSEHPTLPTSEHTFPTSASAMTSLLQA